DKKLVLFLRIKRIALEKCILPSVIKGINLYPKLSLRDRQEKADTVDDEYIRVIQDELVFKPELLEQYILFEPGQRYNAEVSRRTSSRLTSIGNYRYVNIRFDEEDTTRTGDGEGQLEANIYLSPLNKRTLRAELQGISKSN